MQLYFYKKGQGYYTRLWASIVLWAIAAIGSYVLYGKLQAVGKEWLYIGVPVAVIATITWLLYWLQNRPTIADFLIMSEGELKKVSWSSKAEIIASTTIVVFVVIFTSAFLGSIDLIFHAFFNGIGLYS